MPLTHLGRTLALPDDRPFTLARALACGVPRPLLQELLDARVVRRLLKGVYADTNLPDTQLLRARAIRLVVPNGHVVTDESAGWLAGASMILRPGAHEQVPPLTVFATGGLDRMRNGLVDSGRRTLSAVDTEEIEGILVTTPLRTFTDLGRLRHRDRAIGAMDQLLALGSFDLSDVHGQIPRFKGMRGVVQLRTLTPLADRRAESPPESALRLRFHDGGLPLPEPQVEVLDKSGHFLGRVDLAVEHLRFAAEYDGEEFHGPEDARHDEERRRRLRAAGWTVTVIRRENLYGQHQDVVQKLWAGVHEAERRMARRHAG